MKKNKVLRVGFDLDGVLLYNPARTARPLITIVKRLFFKKRAGVFFVPKSGLQRFVWYLLHKSSLFVAPGVNDIKRLIKNKRIKAYIVTARYEFLQADLDDWLKKIDAKNYFEGIYINKKDEQPPVFKKRLIEKLHLDIFIEDNWDIVKHLNSTKTKVFWIDNILDKMIRYPYKFSSLKKAVGAIGKAV